MTHQVPRSFTRAKEDVRTNFSVPPLIGINIMIPWHILASLFLFALKRIYSPIYLAARYPCSVKGCDDRLTRPEHLRTHVNKHDGVTQEDKDKAETTIQNVKKEKLAASRAKRLAKKKSNPPNPPKPRRKKKDK